MDLLLSLEVVEQDRPLLGLLTPVPHDDARAINHLTGITLTIELAYTNHLVSTTLHTTPRETRTYKAQPTRPTSCHQAP